MEGRQFGRVGSKAGSCRALGRRVLLAGAWSVCYCAARRGGGAYGWQWGGLWPRHRTGLAGAGSSSKREQQGALRMVRGGKDCTLWGAVDWGGRGWGGGAARHKGHKGGQGRVQVGLQGSNWDALCASMFANAGLE